MDISGSSSGLFVQHDLADPIKIDSVTVDQEIDNSDWLEVFYSFSTKI